MAVPARGATAPTPATATTTVVPLVTGGQVVVRTTANGKPTYVVDPSSGGSGNFKSFQDGTGDRYIVPAVALPYLGRTLDLSLFDVSALVRDGITGTAAVPVTLTFASGVTPAAPPGVTITSVRGTTAQGSLTASSGGAFTAGLRRQIGADIAAGHPAGTGALFGGLASISLAVPVAPSILRPQFPLAILQLNATDSTGAPANTVAILMNVDNLSHELVAVPINDGIGRVAVPAGNYFALGLFTDFDSNGNPTSARNAVVNDFSVAAAPTVTMQALDERSATAAVTATTPMPSSEDGFIINVDRFDAAGNLFPFADLNLTGAPLDFRISPQPAARVGRLHYVVQWDGTGTQATATPYRYDVAFPSDNGIPADQNFVVRNSQLATVTQRFSSDPANTGKGGLFNGALDPVLIAAGETAIDNTAGYAMPGTQTQFLGTADGGQWLQTVTIPQLIFFNGLIFADPITLRAGRPATVNWGHGPLAPGESQFVGGGHFCLACIAGTSMDFGFQRLNDSTPGHHFIPLFGRTHLNLTAGGVTLFDGRGPIAQLTDVPATPTTFTATMDLNQTGAPGVSQSTVAHTQVTFRSPATGPGNVLPAGDDCDGRTATTPCEILPVLSLSYQLATDQTNTSDHPIQVLGLNVGHLTYDGFGSHARITSAAVSVSFDGGTTWQPANIVGSNGHYLAAWANPKSAQGTDPALMVTATDALGGTITQTVMNAYTIAAGSAS